MRMPKIVIEEARNLRKFATKEEIERLDFEWLVPHHAKRCIYGQMTGDCFNKRAKELIEQSCKRVYDTSDGHLSGAKLNGSFVGKFRPDSGAIFSEKTSYFSPIEVFIYKASKPLQKKLIQFIKGEIEL